MEQRESDKMCKRDNQQRIFNEEEGTENELDLAKFPWHLETTESEVCIPIVTKFSADWRFRKSI